jgi:hypothetical protein
MRKRAWATGLASKSAGRVEQKSAFPIVMIAMGARRTLLSVHATASLSNVPPTTVYKSLMVAMHAARQEFVKIPMASTIVGQTKVFPKKMAFLKRMAWACAGRTKFSLIAPYPTAT